MQKGVSGPPFSSLCEVGKTEGTVKRKERLKRWAEEGIICSSAIAEYGNKMITHEIIKKVREIYFRTFFMVL